MQFASRAMPCTLSPPNLLGLSVFLVAIGDHATAWVFLSMIIIDHSHVACILVHVRLKILDICKLIILTHLYTSCKHVFHFGWCGG